MLSINKASESVPMPESPGKYMPSASAVLALQRKVAELSLMEQRCRRAEAQLKAFEERNRLLGDSAPLGIFTIDTQGFITGINKKMREMLPWPSEYERASRKLSDCQPIIGSEILSAIQYCIGQDITVIREQPYRDAKGVCTHLRYYLSPIPGTNGSANGVIAIVEDYTDLKETVEALQKSERHFRYLALRDNLTGLYNQRYLYQSLAEGIKRAQTTGSPISVIFMDLDNFKNVVDTYGHLNGSRAIQEVARTIDNCLKEPSYAVAYAGDEFVVVLPGLDQKQSMQKAFEIHYRMKNTIYVLDPGIEVRLPASFGTATFPQDATDIKGLIAAADRALFAIKATGKDAVGRFQDP